MKKFFYILLQCTWGGLITFIGLFFLIANRSCEHQWYRCCIDTKWNKRAGLSLGLFTFTPKDTVPNAQLIRVHEYGHTIQNLVLGPLMLFVGLISIAWFNLPCFVRLRERGVPYTACFVEAWASRWGELVSGEKALRQ